MICDGCNKMRKLYRRQEVVVCGEVDDVFEFCFLCVRDDERRAAKAEAEFEAEMTEQGRV